MSDTALQDTPKRDAAETAGLNLEWLTLGDNESIQWASTPHKYSLVSAFIIGIPLSLVLLGIPILVGSYLQYTNTNYVVTDKGLYSKRGILSRDVQQIGFDKIQPDSLSPSPTTVSAVAVRRYGTASRMLSPQRGSVSTLPRNHHASP